MFILSFMNPALGDISVKILLHVISEIFLSMFSSRTFMVSQFKFKSFIHLEFLFWCGVLGDQVSFFFFKKYIYWLCYYSCPIFSPSLTSSLRTSSHLHSLALVHVHGSYLKVLWLLHFLYYPYPPPVYCVPTIYATYSLYLFPLSPPPTPLLITLHVISISVILFLF